MVKDKLTATIDRKIEKDTIPRVSIMLPIHDDEGGGDRIDQYEHVTINGNTTLVKRGERVEVTVPVYIQLRNKFPYI